MPVASGSLIFLGAGRFQGYWNADNNDATGSGLTGAAPFQPQNVDVGLGYTTLLINGGYHSSTNLTASAGDYWQVTGSGTTTINDQTNWRVNDWCIFSGSDDGAGKWLKLSFEDTIGSVVFGDLSSSSFHMGTENKNHVIFVSGSVFSGSANFEYDYDSNKAVIGAESPDGLYAPALEVTGTLGVAGSLLANAVMTPQTQSSNTVIPSGYNAILYSPVHIASGVTMWISGTANLKIKN